MIISLIKSIIMFYIKTLFETLIKHDNHTIMILLHL